MDAGSPPVSEITRSPPPDVERARLAAIVRSSSDAIISKTLEGVITSWNPAAERIFGYTAAEAIGQPLLMLFPPDRYEEEEEILARIARGEVVETFETVRRRKDGTLVDISATISPIRDGDGNVVGASKIARDITRRKRLEREAREREAELARSNAELERLRREAELAREREKHRALHDALTDLPNRRMLRRHLSQAIDRAVRHRKGLGVLFIDLDGFKAVNDELGHQAGDQLLVSVGTRLHGCLRSIDVLARLGGDEFALVAEDVEVPEGLASLGRRIVTALEEPFTLDAGTARISASVGISVFPADGEDAAALLRRADKAMYRVKKGGKNGFAYFADPGRTMEP